MEVNLGVTGSGRALSRPPCTTPPEPNIRLPMARRLCLPSAARSYGTCLRHVMDVSRTCLCLPRAARSCISR